MLKLNFKINKHYLLVHALKQTDLPFPEWVDLQNRLWEKFPRAFYLLSNHSEVAFIGSDPEKEFKKTFQKVPKLIAMAFDSKEFKRLYGEAEKYMSIVEKNWSSNKKVALDFIKDVTGLGIPNKTISVIITHPRFCRAFSFLPYNTISLGTEEDWENSPTTTLCHEIMHLLTKNTETMHALIYLTANNELRIRLNKEGKYFEGQELPEKKDPMYAYAKRSLDLQKSILPAWKNYLQDNKVKDIIEFEKSIKKG